jgi:hypothetical protein
MLDPVYPIDNDWEVPHLGDVTYITTGIWRSDPIEDFLWKILGSL